MTTIFEKYGLNPVKPYKMIGISDIECPYKVASHELIGMEIEVEDANLVGALNKVWGTTADGSLRNNGCEFISKPIPASVAPKALAHLFDVALKQDCSYSQRTSVHVHLNMQDFTSTQTIDLLLVYIIFEKLFYKFTGRGRIKNIYCVPISDTSLVSYLTEAGEVQGGKWSKYTGLNTLPLTTQGTIEFRHMHGTRNVEKLSTWINLITCLKEYIKVTSTKDVRNMIISMHDGFNFNGLLQDIFKTYAPVLKYECVDELNYLGAKLALCSSQRTKQYRQAYSRESPFYNFKAA